jgi:hypothetical protein
VPATTMPFLPFIPIYPNALTSVLKTVARKFQSATVAVWSDDGP